MPAICKNLNTKTLHFDMDPKRKKLRRRHCDGWVRRRVNGRYQCPMSDQPATWKFTQRDGTSCTVDTEMWHDSNGNQHQSRLGFQETVYDANGQPMGVGWRQYGAIMSCEEWPPAT
jgi:hypothetical protein